MSDFICTCGDKGKMRGDQLVQEVVDRLFPALPADHPEWERRQKWRDKAFQDPIYLQDMVVHDLGDIDVLITGFAVDQWMGVGSKRYPEGEDSKSEGHFHQCDSIFYGLLATWKWWKDQGEGANERR